MNKRAQQFGFALLEAMLALAIFASIVVLISESSRREMTERAHKALGNEIAQYNNAVRSLISMEPGTPAGAYTGVGWLQDTTCGGTASEPYLPCFFNNTTRVGSYTYSTVVTNGGPNLITATTTIGPIQVNGQNRADMAGLAAGQANGFQSNYFSPAMAATFYGFTTNPATAVITAVASTNPNAEAWLRVDGSNQMLADLDFDPTAPNRDINNAGAVNAQQGIFATDVRAPIFRDSNNPSNRYIDPSANSLLNDLSLAGGDLNLTNPSSNRITAQSRLDIRSSSLITLNRTSGGDVVVGGAGGSGRVFADDVYIRDLNSYVTDLVPHVRSGTSCVGGLRSGRRYIVSVYGITANKGNGGTLLDRVRVTTSGGSTIASTPTRWINWPDGNAPQSASLAVTAPSNGVVCGRTDGGSSLQITAYGGAP